MESRRSSRYRSVLAIIAGIIFVSTAAIFIRFAQAEADSIVIAAFRMAVASIVLLPIALTRSREDYRRLTGREIGKGLLSGMFLALHFAFWITSLEYTSVASSVVLVTTTPLWVALLSPLVLKERLGIGVLIGLAVSMTGGVIVGLGDVCGLTTSGLVCQQVQFGGRAMVGNLLALAGAWMAAGYMLMGRQLRKKLTTISYAALVYGVAAVILSLAVLLRGAPVGGYSAETYGWLVALGLIPQLLGHSLFNWALKYISAAYVSLTLLGEPIGASVLAFLFLRESPTLLESVGAGFILTGIILGSVQWGNRTNEA